ncbi:MAG: hypothetical protein WCL02_01295 [bacterium]
MTHTIIYTAKPLKRGWYAIYKNELPVEKNIPGVGYSHPAKKRRQRIMKTKSPKKILFSLARQVK